MSQMIELARQWGVSEKAAELHAQSLVWDTTLPWGPGYENQDTTLARFVACGVDCVSLTIGGHFLDLYTTIHRIASVTAGLRKEADKYVLIRTAEDILRAKVEGKLAVSFHFQGSEVLDGDKNMVQLFYDLGVRHILLAFNQKNRAGDGCHERTDCGLSRYGVSLVEEMNRVGMIVDLSHTGYKTTMEAMEVSQSPVIFSHTNVYALRNHARNVRDDQIKSCARKGGVMGMTGFGPILGEISVENFVRHVDYVAQLVGPQHVGIGLDFVYFPDHMFRTYLASKEKWPEGYPERKDDWQYFAPEQLPKVTEALLKRRYSEEYIRGILGENFLRVARQVWK